MQKKFGEKLIDRVLRIEKLAMQHVWQKNQRGIELPRYPVTETQV